MKSVFIYQQLEYRLEVPKEGFEQGDEVPCTLSVKNHGAAAQTVTDVRLELACGEAKAVKDKKPDAFEKISAAEIPAFWEIAPGQIKSESWTFNLDKNCTVTEKSRSLYIVFGPGANSGQALLTVKPHHHIESVLATMEAVFQFVLKGVKSSKGRVEAKFKAPSARRFMMVEELVLGLSFGESTLKLDYIFKVKNFDTQSLKVKVKKGKVEVNQELDKSQYLLSGDYINQEKIEASIEEAISQVASGI